MKCVIIGCELPADINGGMLCVGHQRWTAPRMTRALAAIDMAITREDGLDGLVGEKLLRELGYWPDRPLPPKESAE